MSNYTCGRCKILKPIQEFHKSTSSLGHNSICKKCRASNPKNILSWMLSSAKKRSKLKNREFNISRVDILNLIEKQDNLCAISGVELNWKPSTGNKQRICPPDRASLDRIDSSKGYTKENIQLVTDFVNRVKSWYSTEEFVKFCSQVVERHK
jgi:hypothetical protein